MKKFSFLIFIACFALAAGTTLAQGGGKAEANVIKFAKGKSSAVITATISGDEEAEYSFAARKGQNVTVTNTKPAQFSFNISNVDADYNSGDVSEQTFSFDVPETGEYMFVVKRSSKKAGSGKFSLTLAIK